MNRKLGYCSACHQNKNHRRIAGVFSVINLLLLGIPGLFGISTWQCTHCRTLRVLLTRQRERPARHKSGSSKGSRNDSMQPVQVGQSPKVKSTRSLLYSDKYRDGVVQRIISGITSIEEVKESLALPESDVVNWIKQSFERKEDRVEKLREALELYQKVNPEFQVERLMSDVEQATATKAKSPQARSGGLLPATRPAESMKRSLEGSGQFVDPVQ